MAKHGEAQRARIERGVEQVAALWREEDGDLAAFVREYFIADPKALDATFARLERIFEQLDGHFNELGRELRWATDLDLGPLLPVDPLLAAYDPSAHVTDDLFQSKIGFVVLLNFPLTTLAERTAHAKDYTRRQWAEARLAGRFDRRVPARGAAGGRPRAGAAADLYIAEYNVWMHHVVDAEGRGGSSPRGMRLISHWNLRDELKADYADKERAGEAAADRQGDGAHRHADDPRGGDRQPAGGLGSVHQHRHGGARGRGGGGRAASARPRLDPAPEPDTRYARLLAHFQAARQADPYVPVAPTQIARTLRAPARDPRGAGEGAADAGADLAAGAPGGAAHRAAAGAQAGAAGPVVQRASGRARRARRRSSTS